MELNQTTTLPVLSEKLRAQGKQYKGCAEGQSYADISREDLEPLMIEFGVDLYFAGHMHAYESTWPVHNNTPTADNFVNPTAPVHITTGAGGAPGYDAFDNNWGPWTRKQIMAWGYGRVVAHNASTLSYSHVLNANSSVVDEVVIQQAKHGPFPFPFPFQKTDDGRWAPGVVARYPFHLQEPVRRTWRQREAMACRGVLPVNHSTPPVPCLLVPTCASGSHATASDFRRNDGVGRAAQQTAALVCYDALGLSIIYSATDDNVESNSSHCHDHVWSADALEFMVYPGAMSADPGGNYSELDLSPKGGAVNHARTQIICILNFLV